MTTVRRCDNPDCKLGPGKTPSVADSANPEGWLTVAVGLIHGSAAQSQDACSGDCAVRITQDAPGVASTLTPTVAGSAHAVASGVDDAAFKL